MSRSTRKGSDFERQVADYMASCTGQKIDRRVKFGRMDKGDIAGFEIGGFDAVVECKNCKSTALAAWVEEAERERENARASFGMVVHKRRGCGDKHMGDTYVTMTLDTLLDIWRVAEDAHWKSIGASQWRYEEGSLQPR